jgi:acetyltransferase-like isoleucine patch superfamily enzyme
MLKKYIGFILKLAQRPTEFWAFGWALLRGSLYVLWYMIRNENVLIRFPFLCFTKVEIRGPGKVFIDRQCAVWMNTFDHLIITTLDATSEVRIGKNCTLGGLTIRCRGKVIISDNVMTAGNLIQDVPIWSVSGNSKNPQQEQISIGHNVWLCGQSIVLDNSRIGDGCVIGLNGLVYKATVDCDCIVLGNPSLRPVPISRILSFSEKE